jgi:predicted dinucleotide-binding enzyme
VGPRARGGHVREGIWLRDIPGAGHIGGTLARLFVDAGHVVAVSNSRGPETLASLVEELGERGRAATVAEAARFGEVVVVAIPMGRYRQVPSDAVVGNVVIDANNYYPGRDGHLKELDSDRTTSSELLQAHLPGARVVKAFNAIQWLRLRDDARPAADPNRLGIAISGDERGGEGHRLRADRPDRLRPRRRRHARGGRA